MFKVPNQGTALNVNFLGGGGGGGSAPPHPGALTLIGALQITWLAVIFFVLHIKIAQGHDTMAIYTQHCNWQCHLYIWKC